MNSTIDRQAARMVCVGFDGLTMPRSLRDLLERGVSAVILLGRNYESPAQLAELCREIKSCPSADGRPIMICVDQEGGRVQRLREPFSIIPSMREIGQSGDEQTAMELGRRIGQELRGAGIDMNLAPVLDVDSNLANPVIGERSFGSDPELVARMGCAVIGGLQKTGVAACGKHFPGHGDTTLDSHFELPRLAHGMDRLERVELVPFVAAINAHVAAIMTAHVMFDALDPRYPATMSQAVIDGLLRRHLGFDGVVISDDLEMKAIADHFGMEEAAMRGASAGIDLFLVCHSPDRQHQVIDAIECAVHASEMPESRIQQSNRRLDRLFARYVQPAQAVSAGRSVR